MSKINAFSRVLNQKVKIRFFMDCTDWIIFLMYYILYSFRSHVKVVHQLKIHEKKSVFAFWFNTRENALILLI
jgi:uncharacterized protein YqhQ